MVLHLKEVFGCSNCKCLWKASSVLVKLLLVSLTSGFTAAEHWGLGWLLRGLKLLHIVILNFIFTISPKVYLNKYFMTSKIAHLASLFYISLAYSMFFEESVISRVFHCMFLLKQTSHTIFHSWFFGNEN